MKKIGILVFSNKHSISVGRDGRKDYSFDGVSGKGLHKILSELNRPYEFCSRETIDDYDDAICSLTSYHDVLNLVLNVPIGIKTRIHIGGPACNNIRPILPYIETANFGRCDCGKINGIIDGIKYKSVWRKSLDPEFLGEYEVDGSSVDGLSPEESSYGCRQKCAFCFYSHWNKHTEKNETGKYSSGFSSYEDFFQSLDWQKCIRGGVTALDGITEETRLKINKPIKKQDIIDTLLRSNKIETETRLRVKVYCIAGYPWESRNEICGFDLVSALKEVEGDIRNKITIRMHFSHFIPFQKTPLWNAPFNFSNYRDWCLDHKVIYESGNVRLFSGGTFTPSPSQAAISTILQRAKNTDTWIVERIASRDFQKIDSQRQIRIMKKEIPRFFCEQTEESIGNIKTANKYKAIRRAE
jgi:hypothetical protein